jgi:hypothetical protein
VYPSVRGALFRVERNVDAPSVDNTPSSNSSSFPSLTTFSPDLASALSSAAEAAGTWVESKEAADEEGDEAVDAVLAAWVRKAEKSVIWSRREWRRERVVG